MRTKHLFLCSMLLTVTAVNGQVVYGHDERDYIKRTVTATGKTSNTGSPSIGDALVKYQLSGISDNWFVGVKGGASVYIGQPKGCGDLSDKTRSTMVFSLGKWHSRFFGTRFVYQGFRTKGVASCFSYHNLHADLLLNVSSFFRLHYDPMPKWDVIPYLGAGGIIRGDDLHKHPFAVNYGTIVSYRATKRLHITAEIGGTTTSQDFDRAGKASHAGDNLFQASIGFAVGIGKQGYNKKTDNRYTLAVETIQQNHAPRNAYAGLQRLRERMSQTDTTTMTDNLAKFSTPVLFFFKINTAKLIDRQQLVNISEIASAVKEYGLKVKVAGAADSRTGNEKCNRALSIKRAKYIARLLLKAGVPRECIHAVSEGGIDWYKPYTANRHTCVIVYRDK